MTGVTAVAGQEGILAGEGGGVDARRMLFEYLRGQGERRQFPNQAWGSYPSLPEHMMIGTSALLVGRQAAGYLLWDAIRSLDYLAMHAPKPTLVLAGHPRLLRHRRHPRLPCRGEAPVHPAGPSRSLGHGQTRP